ncbi:MAG: hypothetical protein NZ741_05460, partial [Armatimonadetes bacterium]|nr:hypothetical protein [Armatimonadota bacterium]
MHQLSVRAGWAVLWLCILSSTVAYAEPQNLLQNAHFETDGHWQPLGAGAAGVSFGRMQAGRNGSWCAFIRVELGAKIDWYLWRQFISPAKPGTTYRLSGWVRTERVRGASGVSLSLTAHDASGNRILFADAPRVNGTRGWMRLSTTLTVPEGAVSLSVACFLHGYGQAFFDDLHLEEIPPCSEAELRQCWQRMSQQGDWLLLPAAVAPEETALPLAPEMQWREGVPYGWLSEVPVQRSADGSEMSLQVPLHGNTSATLRLHLPAGEYFLHLWAGGNVSARIPLNIKVNGQVVARRVFPVVPALLRYPFVTRGEHVDVTFEPASQPVPVGESAPSVSIRAIAITRAPMTTSRRLARRMREQKRLLEVTVNSIPSRLPKVSVPSLFPVLAGQVCPEMEKLRPGQPLRLVAARSETVAGGALLYLKPRERFRFSLQGDIPQGWLRTYVGVPGWVRLAGMQRWDFWHSPARWLEERGQGVTTPEGLGLVWLQVAVPANAPAREYRATLRVTNGRFRLALPVRVTVLPLTLPPLDADIGMFYNATMNLACPDDELPQRWRKHLADMKAYGMNCVFVYTFRMLWHAREGEGWRWIDSPVREFLQVYRQHFSRPLYLCTHGDRYHPQGYRAYVQHVNGLARPLGIEVFYMPVDEAFAEEARLRTAEEQTRMVKEAGGKTAMTTDHAQVRRMDEWMDVRVYPADCLNREVLRHTQQSGDVLAVYNGGSTSDPYPARDRFFFGLYAWAVGAKGVFQWAYQWGEGNPLDERDASSHDWCYTLPAGRDYCAPSLN